MDHKEHIIVDFLLSADSAEEASAVSSHHIGKCTCGNDTFALASEMSASSGEGIPASRMFECTACGEYRLG